MNFEGCSDLISRYLLLLLPPSHFKQLIQVFNFQFWSQLFIWAFAECKSGKKKLFMSFMSHLLADLHPTVEQLFRRGASANVLTLKFLIEADMMIWNCFLTKETASAFIMTTVWDGVDGGCGIFYSVYAHYKSYTLNTVAKWLID